ncbi:MAG TPA: hypothetical protein VGS10_11400 [Terracidiphilus sp.]|nr:hypothetical protein [Terracidiphilus sp.]
MDEKMQFTRLAKDAEEILGLIDRLRGLDSLNLAKVERVIGRRRFEAAMAALRDEGMVTLTRGWSAATITRAGKHYLADVAGGAA